MKKIMISLLMVAATVNAFAITYTGKAKLTLTAANNESCAIVIAESADFSDGLNNGYYVGFNEEGKDVQFYVVYGGVKYAHFGSNAATMQDLQLGLKTNASTTYTLTASNVTGSLKIKFAGVEYTINAAGTVFSDLALAANSVLPAAGNEADFVVNPSAPVAPSICVNYNVLEINGHAGESLVVNQGTTEIANETSLKDKYSLDLSAYKGRIVVTLNGEKYQINVNPEVSPY